VAPFLTQQVAISGVLKVMKAVAEFSSAELAHNPAVAMCCSSD
jgi:hypothetical protein